MKKRKYFPSQERYREKHPLVGTNVNIEVRNKLIELAKNKGLTLAQYVREILINEIERVEKVKETAVELNKSANWFKKLKLKWFLIILFLIISFFILKN